MLNTDLPLLHPAGSSAPQCSPAISNLQSVPQVCPACVIDLWATLCSGLIYLTEFQSNFQSGPIYLSNLQSGPVYIVNHQFALQSGSACLVVFFPVFQNGSACLITLLSFRAATASRPSPRDVLHLETIMSQGAVWTDEFSVYNGRCVQFLLSWY